MLSSDSPLKRIPAKLAKRQVLFLNGIRHAAEIRMLSYSRLTDTLFKLAFSRSRPSMDADSNIGA